MSSPAAVVVVVFLLLFAIGDGAFTEHPTAPGKAVMEGGAFSMACRSGQPANVRWTKDGKHVETTNGGRIVVKSTAMGGSTLEVSRAIRNDDEGRYRCESGDALSREAIVDVTWLDAPTVELQYPDDPAQIVKGVDVQLTCEADVGSGDIQYHWFRNAERLSTNSTGIQVKKMKLHLENIDESHNGIYRCAVHLEGETKESKSDIVINIEGKDTPHLRLRPDDLLIPSKTTALFHCRYDNADSVEWHKNESPTVLETNDRITVHQNGSLTIRNVTRRDEGFYVCAAIAKNQNRHLQKFAAKLKIAYIKPLTIMDFEPQVGDNRVAIAQEGSFFSLVCLSSKENSPPSQIMWKNTLRHLISDSGETRVDDGALIIDKVKMSHQGVYTCTSENVAGSQEMSVFIVVNPTVTITTEPKPVIIDENRPVQFTCGVSIEQQTKLRSELKSYWNKIVTAGYLKSINNKHHTVKKNNGDDANVNVASPSENLTKEQIVEKWLNEFNWKLYHIDWKKDPDKSIRDQLDRIAVLDQNQTLKIAHTTPTDKGSYWCQVTASSGTVIKSQIASLELIEKLKFSPPPVDKKLELDTMSKVHCKVHGSPTPTVMWFRDENQNLPENVQSINGTLQFAKVTRGHKGNYTCVAQNSQGKIEASVFIDVVVSPRFIFPLPSQVVEVVEGEPVWIDCIAEGDPEPKTQWDRNFIIITTVNKENKSDEVSGDAINRGVGINENERINLLDNGTLFIKSVKLEDGDYYGCTAGNSAGLKREAVNLIVLSNVIGVAENEDGVITKAVLITMSVVGAYMVLVIGLMVWCRVRRKRKLARNIENEKLENGDVELKEKDGPNDKLIENNDDIVNADSDKYCQLKNAKNKCNGSSNLKTKNGNLRSADNCGNITGGESGQNMSDNSEISANSKSSRKVFGNTANSRYDKIAMQRTTLFDIVALGRGEFGDVLLAKYQPAAQEKNSKTDEVNDRCETKKLVMIKSLLHTRDETCLAEFKRELDMYSKLRHENISEIIGLCNEIEPHYLVFQYTDWGDLKQFLLATRTQDEIVALNEIEKADVKKSDHRTTPLLLPQMLAIAHQISRAMEFISDNRMIHKDLATRNCLITSKLTVKISIPALTKDIYSKEYYKHVNQVIPLRWLPFECVYESDYTSKSDVYMFACTVWEIFHKAELPFTKMSDSTVLSHLKNHTLVWKSNDATPPSLLRLLNTCWDVSIKNRPTFADTTRQIAKILKETSHVITCTD